MNNRQLLIDSKRWSVSLTLLMFFWFMAVVLGVSYSVVTKSLEKQYFIQSLIDAKANAKLSIEDGYSFFKNEKNLFYNPRDISPCLSIWSISSYSNYSTNIFNLSSTLITPGSDENIWNENLKDDSWFINRSCSIYSQWIPSKSNSDYSIKGEWNSFWSIFRWSSDENWYYNIKKILSNDWFWYFFTADQIWENTISLNLDYNFSEFIWTDTLNIFSEDLSNEVLLLKKTDPTIEVSKTNLRNILSNTLYTYDDAFIEIWLIEFDWDFTVENGFNIIPDSWRVKQWEHIDWANNLWNLSWRLLCSDTNKNCQINWIDLNNDSIYFLYVKSFDKPTTFHLDIFNWFWESIFLPTNNLLIKSYWFSEWALERYEKNINLSNSDWYFSEFSSQIYNYVYFSRN